MNDPFLVSLKKQVRPTSIIVGLTSPYRIYIGILTIGSLFKGFSFPLIFITILHLVFQELISLILAILVWFVFGLLLTTPYWLPKKIHAIHLVTLHKLANDQDIINILANYSLSSSNSTINRSKIEILKVVSKNHQVGQYYLHTTKVSHKYNLDNPKFHINGEAIQVPENTLIREIYILNL